MEVVVGSNNEPKRRATERAFGKIFNAENPRVTTVKAESGVADHPTDAKESLAGAVNRAVHAQELKPGADYYVGIEGGLLRVSNIVWEVGWVAVRSSSGQTSTGVSAGLEMRGKLLESVTNGQPLSDAVHDSFGIKDIGEAGGVYGLASDSYVTREDAYEQAIVFALAAFNHPELYE